MTIPVVVQMTVDSGTTYDLSADTNLQEIDLDNELEINVTQYTAPTYEGAYTVDAGLSAVTLETDGKVCTDDIVVNALTENYISANQISVNSSGNITSLVSVSAGYSPTVFAQMFTKQLDTQAGTTITPTTSEQTAVASGKYTTGVVKVGAIPSQYADITGVTANASDVLAGKYFVNNLGVLTLGTAIAGGGDGAPMPVDTVAEMIDTTKVYLYVGSETGYTFGNWYYYDGNDWVSGGKWGADGGVNTNARNLLQYILERVAYTDTDMEVYVNALYEALAQAGAVTTTYTITNALSHVTNSNNATGCNSGDSYSATLTAETNYAIDTVTITMGGTDITSTAYNNGVITIASVTGNVVITATAIAEPAFQYGLVDNSSAVTGSYIDETGAIQTATSKSGYYADYINISSLSSVVVGFSGSEYNYRISIYDASKTFIRQIHAQQTGDTVPAYWLVDFNSGESYIRLGWYANNPVFYLLDATPVTLPMQIGDVDGTTGQDKTDTRRIRTADYIPVCGAPNTGKVAVTGSPFDTTWSDWITAPGSGYFFRCFDSSYNILGTLIGTSSQMFKDDITKTPTTGTAYVRMLCQQGNSNIPSGFATNATRFIIDGVVYIPTEVS